MISIVSLSLLFAALSRTGPVEALFSQRYLPHRFCYLASPALIWTNATSDAVIALSYLAIFVALLSIALRLRTIADLRPYVWIFLSFAIFIVACGATHAMEIVTIWLPLYPLSAAVKVVCAVASVVTAILFTWATPQLSRKIPQVVQLFSRSQQERDEARSALLASERVLAERQRAEAEIAAVNARLNHIMDSTSDCILKIGYNWKLVYANRQALSTLPEVAIGKNYWDCFPEALGTQIEYNLRTTMEQRLQQEWERYWPNHEQWYSARSYPSEGGISIFFVQVTRQKKLEEALKQEIQRSEDRKMAFQQSNLLLNHVLDSTQEGVLLIENTWKTLYANRPACEVLPDLRLNADFWECYPDLIGSPQEAHLRTTMADKVQTTWTHYYEPYQKWFEGHCYPAPGGISLFFRDVTEHRKLQDELELERALREKRIEALSNMAGGLAHEISNPLAIIHATASDLCGVTPEALDPAEITKSAQLIVLTADRASRILRGLRGFTRQAGNDPMEYASVYGILDEAFQMQQTRFERESIALILDADLELPNILCRETQIGQIINNLLNNSFDAIVERQCPTRWVTVQATSTRDQVQIDVIDSGFGIDQEARKHLMDPFFTTKTRGLGMGVGLSLSRAIAHEHGGSLELIPDAKHTTFRLLLPVDFNPSR